MGQVADGASSATVPASESDAGDSSNPEPHSRGIFGRILEAFGASPSENEDDTVANTDAPAVVSLAHPGIGNLRKLRVGDVAIPKVEIVSVPSTINKDDLVEVFRKEGYSRLPVFKGTLDTPLGLVHLKDLALEYGFGATAGRFTLRKLLRPLLYVPPSMPIGVLLQKMQVQRIHMALVIDEYGGVDGLVTLEDLIEQVIGEIEDEHDEAENGYWKQEKPGQWVVQARAPLREFEAAIGMTLAEPEDEQEIDSMGGLVFMQIGRVPARGEVITAPDGVEYEILDADPRRIKRMRVRLPGVAAE